MRILSAGMTVKDNKRVMFLEVPFSQASLWLENNEQKLPNEYDLKIHRQKRSNDANAYMWQLADKIASEVGITKEEVYRSHIKEVGVFTDLQIQTNAVESFVEGWEHNGIGWFTDIIQQCEVVTLLRVYYGSSSYDTKQMSRLIANVVAEAKQLNIETLTPDELERMVQQWNVITK